MEDIKNIRISQEATKIAELLESKYYFPSITSVLRFSLSLSLRDYIKEIDYETLDYQYSSDGINLNTGTIDNEVSIFRTLIPEIIPGCNTPYRFARVAIIYGLFKIREKIEENPSFNITDLM